jgi:hypothetical protein
MPPKDPEIAEIKQMVVEIHTAIAGNDKLGLRGLRHSVEDHEQRISNIETDNRKFKWKAFVKGVGVGAGSASSAFALGSTKAGAAIVKAVTAIGAIIFVCYLVMLIL